MAIFNEAFTDNLIVLNEKKTREEYRRRAAEKHFKFEPDKPGSKDGTITDKKGKQYQLETDKYYVRPDGTKFKKGTSAKSDNANSKININSDIFKLKGSNHGERIKAAIEHEIGHQNLHNFHPDNKTVDPKNRNVESFRRSATRAGISASDPNYSALLKRYLSKSTATDEDLKDRQKSLKAAEKYENTKSSHTKAEEFEADRYAANQTSDRAVRNMIKNVYRNQEKELKKSGISSNIDKNKTKEEGNIDKANRLKALKDKEIRNGKAYK